jgi:ribonuclease P protein component
MSFNALTPLRRLRRKAEFQRVFDTGRRTHGRFLTIVGAPDGGPCARLGIVASKKLGGAVVRNRAKRLIREVFRTTPASGRPLDLVVIPKAPLLTVSFEALERDFRSTLRRCQELSKK